MFGVLRWYNWLVTFLPVVPIYLPIVPLVNKMEQMVKKCNTIGTNVTDQWYHLENSEHTHCFVNVIARIRGSPMVPLVGNVCTNLIAKGTIGEEIGANGKNGNTIGYQWYKC